MFASPFRENSDTTTSASTNTTAFTAPFFLLEQNFDNLSIFLSNKKEQVGARQSTKLLHLIMPQGACIAFGCLFCLDSKLTDQRERISQTFLRITCDLCKRKSVSAIST